MSDIRMTMYTLLLGSNSGNPIKNLSDAIARIKTLSGQIHAESGTYKTAPWGNTNQHDFLNKLVLFETEMTPDDLLNNLLDIEQEMGRVRLERWGPRIIDIDILYAESKVIRTAGLHIPHPGIPERRFALVPLNELMPDFIHPELGLNQRELLSKCVDSGSVELLHEPISFTPDTP